ncbi:Tim44-like domain-containing protein [Limnohabitans sp. INBF002]|uniref:Tim44 domain-containing protein n=1 Tax=Limnohabitans sp. INBF002 TaxID=2986280 RepID=UPI00237799B0|nr:Tim44-like domain-containing protein [Limnohabitans sp. INBF002]BDU53941.1 membrane protein [Limnohabitans sp. INBF002]
MKKLLTAIFVVAMAFATMHAEAAKRLGGGKSTGQQSSNVTQREAAKPAPAATPSAAPAAPAAAPAAAPSRFGGMGGMLGGLAAGLGLAWLAHSMGFGAEFGQFLMFGVLALVVMMVIGAIMRRRQQPAAANNSPYAFEGAGAPANPATLPQYNPKNVGNDSSARPVDTHTDFAPVGGGSMIGSALGGNQTWGIPADFDTAGFVSAAKQNFMTLQQAWDRSDIAALRVMMTDSMLDEIKAQLAEREATANGQVNHTDVVMLDAHLLGIEDVGNNYMASVEFSGLIREEPSSGPTPFREVWNMTKPKDGSLGWLVAGVQALQ